MVTHADKPYEKKKRVVGQYTQKNVYNPKGTDILFFKIRR